MSWIDSIVSWFTRKGETAVVTAGELAASEAERLWALDIIDPPKGSKDPRARLSLETINEILHETGWSWAGPYLGNGSPQWCGLFAGKCWRAAGLDPKWLATFWASTIRLDNWAKGEHWNGTKAGGPRPMITLRRTSKPRDCVFPDGSVPRRGDVVVVGDGNPVQGDHITICVAYDPATGIITTISGNGGGAGPDGRLREGISKRNYRVGSVDGYTVLRVYRPIVSDLLAIS